ncbi:hypothetical protein HaLaN_10139 [Haematococcus lacustris]|uniref:Uncharacterized protein n=1 Tax=Haematococcus lacustris TaxID=44745 RepID=A0A699ZF09_HAELA|nr:hypothetical protein HaLaN_10139 [Haematococcus lacustris]
MSSCCSCRASGGWESRLASASFETQSPPKVRAVRLGKLSSRCRARPDLHCCTIVQLCQGLQGWSRLLAVALAVLLLWLPQGKSQLACSGLQGCDNTGSEQLVAALRTQLDAQGWDVQQVGLGEGAAAGRGKSPSRSTLASHETEGDAHRVLPMHPFSAPPHPPTRVGIPAPAPVSLASCHRLPPASSLQPLGQQPARVPDGLGQGCSWLRRRGGQGCRGQHQGSEPAVAQAELPGSSRPPGSPEAGWQQGRGQHTGLRQKAVAAEPEQAVVGLQSKPLPQPLPHPAALGMACMLAEIRPGTP